ncbi:cytochrome P460 family protein [Rhizobium sp. Leaf453]|uniref:cytochrome P460 family protein n=1 Tax=Rhizobium sp. Leaf453 TaxID=1736380 RepID=UPI001FCCDDCB|nr:cytochrome P460 family protein [Rhizobium sp. Leaf453]
MKEIELRKLLATCSVVSAALALTIYASIGSAGENVSPVYGVGLPEGYRDWRVITVAHEAGQNNDIRAVIGNDIAYEASRAGTLPFPDGAIIVRLAYEFKSSPRNDAVFPAPQSFVAGNPTNVQISVKDSKKYADTGGWGYGQFENGIANPSVPLTTSCFACHQKLDRSNDFVFSHYSP